MTTFLKPWFPPATHTLRLRHLSTLYLLTFPSEFENLESCLVSFHESLYSPPFLTYKSVSSFHSYSLFDLFRFSAKNDERERNDRQASTEFVLRFSSSSTNKTWSLHLSGLTCFGSAFPLSPTSTAPLIVFHLTSGLYFGLSSTQPLCRHLYIDKMIGSHILCSYDLPLLCRLHALHRAVKNQERLNTSLKEDCKRLQNSSSFLSSSSNSSFPSSSSTSVKLSLKALLYDLKRSAKTREKERALLSKTEVLELRISSLLREKESLILSIQECKQNIDSLSKETSFTKSFVLKSTITLRESMDILTKWKDLWKASFSSQRTVHNVITKSRIRLLSSLNEIFPMEVKGEYLRGIQCSNLTTYSKLDNGALAVLGWIAQILFLTSTFLDVPLRYPICLTSLSIVDVMETMPKDLNGFSLHLSGSNAPMRIQYGIYLLNKNIAQLRWYLGKKTTDLRLTLHNLEDLLSVGSSDTALSSEEERALLTLSKSVPVPPWL